MTSKLPVLCCLSLIAAGPLAFARTSAAPLPAVQAAKGTQPAKPAARRYVDPGPAIRRGAAPVQARVVRANRRATREPLASGFRNAVQVYPYAEGSLYQVYAAPERVTDIALQPGESLISVAAGDTARWIIGDTTSGTGAGKRTHVLVKPFASGLATNIVITTDRRSYHLALASTGSTAMVALSWTYAQDALLALKREAQARAEAMPVAEGIPLDRLRFDYALSGDSPPWRPLRVFDDGRQTYVEFPRAVTTGEAPPLFLVDRQGEAQLVNYRVQGRFYVVDRIFETAELRLGLKRQDVVRITRRVAGQGGGKRS